jgi:hypothetical protein
MPSFVRRTLVFSLVFTSLAVGHGPAEGTAAEPSAASSAYTGAGCEAPVDRFFLDEVWGKVASQSCLTCHKTGGDAEDTKLVLRDPSRSPPAEQDAVNLHNRNALARMARIKEADKYRILLKVVGELDHGGADVLPADSTGYKILADFVKRTNLPHGKAAAAASLAEDKNAPPFFAGVAMLDDRRLLRRATLSLAGRLPTPSEQAAVESGGLKAIGPILDGVLKEEAFYERLREGFNDIFLTLGVDGNPDQTVLSYDYFSTTRQWYQKEEFEHIKDPAARQKAKYKLADDYRASVLGEPMKLIEHIVRNDRPFTELVTADYIMVSPLSSKGYGVFDEVKGKFKNLDDPFEYVPVRLKALVGRQKSDNQESASGYYPHAGMLTTFQWIRRYPNTETNRNRLRVRMFYEQFLGVDVLELAARVADAAAVTAKFEIPTMQASDCVVCHKTIDPVAGLFQDFHRIEGTFGRRKEGWYKDMFSAGFEGEEMPAAERWRSLQWLGERTAKDPRFATTMVEHVYYILTGRKVLLPPKELDDPLYAAKRRAYVEQRKEIERIAARMVADNFNLKTAFKEWVVSEFYRADGLATAATDPKRQAELDDIGVVRMLGPEQVERKLTAVFGEPWGQLGKELGMLYGGIDSKAVTERAADPSGAMGAIQRIMANDVACKQTLKDFARKPADRRLFPEIEPEVVPGSSPQADAAVRRAIVHLHTQVLGRYDEVDSTEVDRTYDLLHGIVVDASMQKIEKSESYYCRTGVTEFADPHYTIRAWRAVVTYLLRRQDFLYE